MSFLDQFKGRIQRVPKEGYLHVLGTERGSPQGKNKIDLNKLNKSLQKITTEELKLQYEIDELDDYQMNRYSKLPTELDTPKSNVSRKNLSAIRSARNILKY